jgi:AAA family ATP:ADP antiporter
MLRAMKTALFLKIVGGSFLGYAKFSSVVFLIVLVLLYGKLVDLFSKQNLVYVITTTYGLLFLGITYFLMHPTIGIANTTPSGDRYFGWLIYVVIESFGSIVVALFWSFVASSVDASSAKKGYPIIIFGAQLGAVLGTIVDLQVSHVGIPKLFGIALAGIFTVPLLIAVFMRLYAEEHHSLGVASPSDGATAKGTGPIEGLRLLCTRPYLIGILGLSTLYTIIETILDLQMYRLANQVFLSPEKVTEFSAFYGLCANMLSLIFSLIGTSFFIRYFGLTTCLILYPLTLAVAVCTVWAFPVLWVFVGAIVASKGLSYALNNPCKEIMYIPTSRDIRFKTKSWIDTFGARSAKGMGGLVVAAFPVVSQLITYGSIISLSIIGVWIGAAWYVGKTNRVLVDQNKLIE